MLVLNDDARLIKFFCETHRNIYIFGAGYKGERLYEFLSSENIPVVSFVVSQLRNERETLKGIGVQEVAAVRWRENTGVIVSTDEDYWKEIKSTLDNCGVNRKDVFFCHIWKSKKTLEEFYDSSFLLYNRGGYHHIFTVKI